MEGIMIDTRQHWDVSFVVLFDSNDMPIDVRRVYSNHMVDNFGDGSYQEFTIEDINSWEGVGLVRDWMVSKAPILSNKELHGTILVKS